jgi:acetyl esterase/lipase
LRNGVQFATVDGQSLVADLYLPKGKGPFPSVIYLHGGGWRNGNRSQLHRQAELMAEHGFMGMAFEYRLAPAHPYPAALEDARTAVRWLRRHAGEYNVNSDHIAAVGSSAGGHLAAMLGVNSVTASGRHRNDDDASVQAVVAFNGIFDLEAMPPSTMMSDLIGANCAAATSQYREASPIDHVHPGLPPFLILQGTADTTAPFAQADAFVKPLQQDGDTVQLFAAEGAPHTFWIQPRWLAPSFEAMRTFLKNSLR